MNVGDIVHYVSYGTPGGEYKQRCRAAVVSEKHADFPLRQSLVVLNPTGMFFNERVKHDATKDPLGGTWHAVVDCPDYRPPSRPQ